MQIHIKLKEKTAKFLYFKIKSIKTQYSKATNKQLVKSEFTDFFVPKGLTALHKGLFKVCY